MSELDNQFTHTTTIVWTPIELKNKKKRRMIRGYGGKKMDHNMNHPMFEKRMSVEEAVKEAAEVITGVASFLNEEPIQKIVKNIKKEQNIDKENIRKMEDESCLEEATRIISGHRQDDYGTPEDSFQRIADYWNSYLFHRKDIRKGYTLEPKDVAMMMVLFKIARLEHSYTHDSCVDICGYTAIYDNMNKD